MHIYIDRYEPIKIFGQLEILLGRDGVKKFIIKEHHKKAEAVHMIEEMVVEFRKKSGKGAKAP